FSCLLLCGFAAAKDPIVIYLAGDSTMAQKTIDRRPETGWGEALQQYFSMDQVRVQNDARNGRSTRTFIEEGRWQGIVDKLKPGENPNYPTGVEDNTHYTPLGAETTARLAVEGIREAKLDLVRYLKDKTIN